MIKQKIIIIIILTFNLTCCQAIRIVYAKPKPFIFKKTSTIKIRKLRIHKEDKEVYNKYISKFRKQLSFHNKQIDDYIFYFKKEEDESKK